MADEVKQDIKEAKKELSFNGRVVDGKYVVNYNIREFKNKEWSYAEIPKIFDKLEDFNSYTETFFNQ